MKFLIEIVVLLILVLAGCSIQTTVKYQCVDGSFVDSANLCPSKTCPESNCPKLDCASCPDKTETKNIINYQCYDGTIKDSEKECTKTKVELAQEDCPKLDMFKPKQNIIDKSLYSVEWQKDKDYGGWTINCGLTCTSNCRKGNEEGENINYYYCGKNFLDEIQLKKTITDKEGNILEIITKNVVIVYNNNFNYIQNTCA